jgi:hypothetical protein
MMISKDRIEPATTLPRSDEEPSATAAADLVAEFHQKAGDSPQTEALRLDIERGLPAADSDWT